MWFAIIPPKKTKEIFILKTLKLNTADLVKAGVIAALYIALTLLNPLSYGAIQFRFSEFLNNLAPFNKRYIWALTLGCAIANLNSPLGIYDVIFGSLGTLAMTTISYLLGKHIKTVIGRLAITVTVCTLMSWSVALEYYLLSNSPFWATYFTVALGEFGAVFFGAIIVFVLNTRIDLTK